MLLVQAQVSMHLGATWRGTFWLYHVQLLTGFGAILWGTCEAVGLRRIVPSGEWDVVTS